jgi:hypothetical protein
MAKENNKGSKIDNQAMMEVYLKADTPGAPHKALVALEGSWNTRAMSWRWNLIDPQKEAQAPVIK